MHTIECTYTGNLRSQAKHISSGNELITDAPLDNQGLGQAFSPTDLLCTALSTCMMTIMGIAARTHQINIDGMHAEVEKIMGSDPRRVIGIHINFSNFPVTLDEKQLKILTFAAENCPVAKSLHPDIVQKISMRN